MTDIKAKTVQEPASDAASSLVVVDIGKKQKRKAIKQLRKGKGKLTRKVSAMLAELRENNALPEGSPLVIVVREKRKRPARKLFGSL